MGFFYDQTANIVRHLYDSRIVGDPVLDPAEHFPDAERFVDSWRAIRDEVLAVAANLEMVPRFHEITALCSSRHHSPIPVTPNAA